MSTDIHTEVQEPLEPVESELAPLETPADETPEQKDDEKDDDHIEGAVEIRAGEVLVPKGAVVSERKKRQEAEARLAELEPQLAKVAEIQAWYDSKKALVEFLEKNQGVLQPREPEKSKAPADDTEAVAYAKRFQLYAQDGTPDAVTARSILDDHRRIAREEAQQAVRPYAQQTLEQRAAGNLQRIKEQKDASGAAVGDEALNATAGLLIAQMGRDNALALFADPGNASVIAAIAHGLQAMTPKKSPVKAPEAAPLETEQAGGGGDIRVSEHSLRVTGLKEPQYRDAAKRFKPGVSNSLE